MTVANTTMNPKIIAFFGATGGCTQMALQKSLEAGHSCVALCRKPSKLTDKFPGDKYPNLRVLQGNAHDASAVGRCLVPEPGRLVDTVVFGIGGAIDMSTFKFDDPHVCENGIATVLAALAAARQDLGIPAPSSSTGSPEQPRRAGPKLVAISSTGISRAGKDIPCLMVPLYKALLKIPHADKALMEKRLVASGEDFSAVRPSWLVDRTPEQEAAEVSPKPVRVGIEDGDQERVESREIGYTISRSAVGRWIFENLIENPNPGYERKMVSLTW